MGFREIAPLILNIGAMWELVVSFMPCHFAPQEGTLMPIEQEAGGPQTGLDILEKRQISCPCWGSSSRLSDPHPSVRSLRYPSSI
jgi:hypothetical protein